jgi:micrococcal nuclease
VILKKRSMLWLGGAFALTVYFYSSAEKKPAAPAPYNPTKATAQKSAPLNAPAHSSARVYCHDFGTQPAAQLWHDAHRGESQLDGDSDGQACELLPRDAAQAGAQAAPVASIAPMTPLAQQGAAQNVPANMPANTSNIEGVVTSVHDGDTLQIMDNAGRQYTIRLNAIDAPEMDQAFGQQAKNALWQLCGHARARVEYVDTDKYKRTVGRVACNQTNAQAYMVQGGFAWVYDKYVGADGYLYVYQKNARARAVGLWQQGGEVAPWDWRHFKNT